MKMPDEIYAHAVMRRGDEVLLGVDTAPTNEPDSTRYIRADIHEALRAEVQALRDENRGLKRELLEYMPSAEGLVNSHPDDDPSGYWKELGLRIQKMENELKEQADD